MNYWRFEVLLLFSSQYHDFHGDYYIFLQERVANRSKTGKSHAVCINFLSPSHIETFTFCVHHLAPFLWSGFEVYERHWTDSTGWRTLFIHAWAAGIAPCHMRESPPYRSEGTATHNKEVSDATCTAKASRLPSPHCSLHQAHLAWTPAAPWCWKNERWKIIREQSLSVLSTSYNS